VETTLQAGHTVVVIGVIVSRETAYGGAQEVFRQALRQISHTSAQAGREDGRFRADQLDLLELQQHGVEQAVVVASAVATDVGKQSSRQALESGRGGCNGGVCRGGGTRASWFKGG